MKTKTKALFDVSVLVDALTNEDDPNPESLEALSLATSGEIQGFVSAAAIDGLHDILTRAHGILAARAKIQELRATLGVATVDATVVDAAVALGWNYLDDALTHECARVNGLDRVITLNPTDFPDAALPVQAPGQFLQEVDGAAH